MGSVMRYTDQIHLRKHGTMHTRQMDLFTLDFLVPCPEFLQKVEGIKLQIWLAFSGN